MTLSPITNKVQMYELLANNKLGNTVEQYFDVDTWLASGTLTKIPLWGIRSLEGSGDPRSVLNVHRNDVPHYIWSMFKEGERYNISPMVDQYALLRAQVCEIPGQGLILEYVDPTVDLSKSVHAWREGFTKHRHEVTGVLANAILRAYMNEIDHKYLGLLLDDYPQHVIEFTVCNREVGRWLYYNTIIWEVRKY